MRLEVAGAQITDAVAGVIDTLQNDPEVAQHFADTLDEIAEYLLLDVDTDEARTDSKVLGWLRSLRMLRRDIATLSSPPDVDLPENDTPQISI